jgi:cellulose synthase/poly-beta-1,6-N-acetylglucosamine synthase-like glycosyltransferase
MIILLELAISFFAVVSLVYVVYFVFVLRTKRKKEYVEKLSATVGSTISRDDLPKATILIPAYNEEETMYAKIKNISEFDYPHDKIEVFVLDDSSTDKTREIVESAFKEFNVTGRILPNETRRGVNYSYNQAMAQVNSEYVLTTDADAMIPHDSMLSLVKILTNLKDVGAVAARMLPTHDRTTAATRTAEAYADSYNSMLLAESAIFSTFPGSTSCMLMRKSAFSPISTSYGSSDGNISLSVIRKGSRFILAPNVVYYEPVSQKIPEQRRQKIRRATRLIQSTLLNLGIISTRKYGMFSRIIFPARLLMMTLCPILVLGSLFFFLAFTFFLSSYLFLAFLAFVAFVVVLGIKTDIKSLNLAVSFLVHQTYLFVGLLLSYRKMRVWKRIERKMTN